MPTRIYGGRDGVTADERDGNLLYRPFANEAFVDDLRTCRGVVATAGYSLMSEAVYLRKPFLALPLAGQFEQEMNSRYLAQLGYGTASRALDEAGARCTSWRASRGSPRRSPAIARTATPWRSSRIDQLVRELAR